MNPTEIADLHFKVALANSKCEQAIAAYDRRKQVINAECEFEAFRVQIAKRDDAVLQELGSRCTFAIANAQRLASFLTIELLSSVWEELRMQGVAREKERQDA